MMFCSHATSIFGPFFCKNFFFVEERNKKGKDIFLVFPLQLFP